MLEYFNQVTPLNISETSGNLWIERVYRKRRHSKIYKKQEDSLIRTCDADGWKENTQKDIRMETNRQEN